MITLKGASLSRRVRPVDAVDLHFFVQRRYAAWLITGLGVVYPTLT